MVWPGVVSTRSRLRLLLPVLLAFGLASPRVQAQTSSSKGSPAEASSGLGFSIETEMLTYRALESNGEAIACDVAGYLHSAEVSFKNLAPGSVCNVTGTGGGANAGVVILPFDRNVFGDFQIWRSDLQTMAEFEQRGASACPAKQPGGNPGFSSRGLASPAAAAAASIGGVMGAMTPAGAILSTGSGVLGLFASDHSSSPTGGTIQDQAFMDDVSRELRGVDVSVLMPSVYTPYALTSIDPSRSPFLIALDKLLHTRDCLSADKTKSDADLKNIDAFLASLSAPTTPAKSAAPATATDASTTAAAAAPAPTTTDASSKAASTAPSHLQSVLSADGLAVRLGADPQTGQIPDTAPHHVLLLKALESGGSISRSSNLFGTKLSYSGGSVGTYALFGLNGDLECSGNVYDYAGFVSAKNFQKQLHAYKPDPSKELVFIRGGCRAK